MFGRGYLRGNLRKIGRKVGRKDPPEVGMRHRYERWVDLDGTVGVALNRMGERHSVCGGRALGMGGEWCELQIAIVLDYRMVGVEGVVPVEWPRSEGAWLVLGVTPPTEGSTGTTWGTSESPTGTGKAPGLRGGWYN